MITETHAFHPGIALARSTFAQLDGRSHKWKSRHVPIYIREHLWRPYYLTENCESEPELYIIRLPNEQYDRVHFVRWEAPSP